MTSMDVASEDSLLVVGVTTPYPDILRKKFAKVPVIRGKKKKLWASSMLWI